MALATLPLKVTDYNIRFKQNFDNLFNEKHLLVILNELYGIKIEVIMLGRKRPIHLIISPSVNCEYIINKMSKYVGKNVTYYNNGQKLCSQQPIETLNITEFESEYKIVIRKINNSIDREDFENCN